MGFWHTGYAEFHEPTGLENYVYTPPMPVRYGCERCSESFTELEELRKHRFEMHPVRQPTLLVRGKPVGAFPLLVMTPLHATDLLVQDASSCLLNGQPIELRRLGKRLAASRHEFAEVELLNEGASTRYMLDFRVADETDLAGVEAGFLRLARERVLNINSISRFNDDCRAFSSAMTYCDGISHYLYGVMAKERSPDSGLKQEEYVQRFLRSSEELSGFDRPLGRTVRSLIAFHFNHFGDAEDMAPEGALRQAAGAFWGLLQGMPWHFDRAFSPALGDAVENLLTDQETLDILADASCGLLELKGRTNEMLTHLRRNTSMGYDHLKRMLLAAEALAACDEPNARAEARRLARSLAGKPETAAWAKAMLERLAKP